MRNITLRIKVMSTILSTLCNIAVNYLRVFEVENLCKSVKESCLGMASRSN